LPDKVLKRLFIGGRSLEVILFTITITALNLARSFSEAQETSTKVGQTNQ
jgi:hypothetical protein